MASIGVFGWNFRGFSFEVQNSCRNASTPVKCGVSFRGSDGAATAFGPFSRSGFEPDPDIAGIGVFAALFAQAYLVFVLALVFWVLDAKKKPVHYASLFFFSDMFTLLAGAYIVNFVWTGKCSMSTYHYYVALDSILVACSTMLVTFAASGRHYWRTYAGVPRLLCSLAIFTCLGILIVYQMSMHARADFPTWRPPKKGSDSALLLPVSCFMDPDLIRYENPYSPSRNFHLTAAQLRRIGPSVTNVGVPDYWLYLILTALFLSGILLALAQRCRRDPRKQEKSSPRKDIWPGRIWTGLIFASCLVTDIYCLWHVSGLRSWARHSGWLKDDREDRLGLLSQIMPIFTLAGLVFLAFDKCKTGGKKEKRRKLQAYVTRVGQIGSHGYSRV